MQIMQEQLSATLLVMRSYLVLPGASRARLKAPTFGAWTFVIQLRFLGLIESEAGLLQYATQKAHRV